MRLRIATWNVNSVRARVDAVCRLASEVRPDIICLQETKVEDSHFPLEPFRELGYIHDFVHGMKSYNGVAILSRMPLENPTVRAWCDKSDCRYIFAALPGGIELHNCYLPAGGDIPDPDENDKFAHKLQFMKELAAWWSERRDDNTRAILVGDLNVAPLETDVWSTNSYSRSSAIPYRGGASGSRHVISRLDRRGSILHPARSTVVHVVELPGARLVGQRSRSPTRPYLGHARARADPQRCRRPA